MSWTIVVARSRTCNHLALNYSNSTRTHSTSLVWRLHGHSQHTQYKFLTLLVTVTVTFVVHIKKAFQNVYHILLSHNIGSDMNIMHTTKTPANPCFRAFSFSHSTSSEYFHLGGCTAMYVESVKTTLTRKKINTSDLKNPCPSNELTPCSRVLLENPTVPKQLTHSLP